MSESKFLIDSTKFEFKDSFIEKDLEILENVSIEVIRQIEQEPEPEPAAYSLAGMQPEPEPEPAASSLAGMQPEPEQEIKPPIKSD